MRRRWSGLLAAIAVAQFSLGGTLAPCAVGHAHTSMAMQGMSMPLATVSAGAMPDAGDSSGHPLCDHSGSGLCAGMLSCSVAIGSAPPTHGAGIDAHDAVAEFVSGRPQEPRPSPETPPPRV